MNRRRWILGAALVAWGIERALAHVLVARDAAGHLLSAGGHSGMGTVVAVVVFLALRVALVLAMPAVVMVAGVEVGTVIRRRRRT